MVLSLGYYRIPKTCTRILRVMVRRPLWQHSSKIITTNNKDYNPSIKILLGTLLQHHLRHHERHHHHHEHQHKHKKTTTTRKNNSNNQHQLFIHLMDVMINDCGWSDGVMEWLWNVIIEWWDVLDCEMEIRIGGMEEWMEGKMVWLSSDDGWWWSDGCMMTNWWSDEWWWLIEWSDGVIER